MTVTVNLDKPVSIVGLYDKIAEAAGVDPKMVEWYDCTKVLVAENLSKSVEEWYKINGGPDYRMAFGMAWVNYGPKVHEELADNEARFTDDFMTMKEEEE